MLHLYCRRQDLFKILTNIFLQQTPLSLWYSCLRINGFACWPFSVIYSIYIFILFSLKRRFSQNWEEKQTNHTTSRMRIRQRVPGLLQSLTQKSPNYKSVLLSPEWVHCWPAQAEILNKDWKRIKSFVGSEVIPT